MKKKWQIIMGLALGLMMLIPAAPAAAQEDKQTASADSANVRGSLAVIAPWAVAVKQEFTARVFLRETQNPFTGAGVWAITPETADNLKDQLGILREGATDPADADKDYEALLEKYGVFLGRSGEDGRVSHSFKEGGKYILVAARKGLLPGFTHIRVGDEHKGNVLVIKAPKRAIAGEEVTIGVFSRLDQGAVEGAGVWAVAKDNIEAIQQEVQKLKEDTKTADAEKDYEALVKNRGQFLGRTNKEGQVNHKFKETGAYLLVAIKKGYYPGFSPISIVDKPERKALDIKVTPPQTEVGKEVRIRVTDHETNDAVGGAGVWAIKRDNADSLRDEISALKGTGNSSEPDYDAFFASRGRFLGRTDADGKLGATFEAAGAYVLVTAKKGYFPGFTTLSVRENKPKPAASTNTTAVRPSKPDAKPVTPPSRPKTNTRPGANAPKLETN